LNDEANVSRVVINILGFQTAWWACVLSARANASWIGIGVTAAVFALHLARAPRRQSEAWFIPLAALLGFAADTTATLLDALRFSHGLGQFIPTPLWVMALWLAFATTLNTTFAWLRNHLVVAVVLGVVSGPLSYAAGAALGVVNIPDALWSIAILGLLWGTALPVLVLIGARATRHQQPSPVADLGETGETA
jgi:hypothetical protein